MARLVCVTLLLGALMGAGTPGAQAPARPPNDLDAFMEKVLARRDENWKKLQQYVLDEREQFHITGPANLPIWGDIREYTWYLRDGYFVRSPVKANGVTVSEADRRDFEDKYFRRVKQRDARRGRGAGPAGPPPDVNAAPAAPEDSNDVQSLIVQTRQPEFIDSAYFLRFKFEASKYAFVGREVLEGREVLRIEYYPARLFSREQDQQRRRIEQNRSEPSRDWNAAMERMMNKVALVTIWVEPTSHQIVKYTFDNVNLDFLPGAWLVHMDDAKATMTMSQPMTGVWLPRDVNMLITGTLAVGSFDIRYRLDYSNYRQAETASRFRIGRGGE